MTRNENRDFDEESIARAFKNKMSGLDDFIPPTPPFSLMERGGRSMTSGALAASSGGRLRRATALLMAAAVVTIVVAAVVVPRAILPVAEPSPTPNPSATPPVSPAPTNTRAITQQVIYKGVAAGLVWSPDGTKLAFSDNADQSQIHILGVDGQQLASVPGDAVAWVDSSNFIALQADGQAYAGRVGDSYRSPMAGKFKGLISGSGGQVAFELQGDGSDGYKVWSQSSGLGTRRDGLPVAFSPDGSKLAVVHNPAGCCVAVDGAATPAPGKPTLDVTDTSTGKSLAKDTNIAQSGVLGYLVSFSPDGNRIADLHRTTSGTSPVGVIDIATTVIWEVVPSRPDLSEEPGEFIWLGNSSLQIVPWSSAVVPPGMPVAIFYGDGASYVGATSSTGEVARIRGGRTADGGGAGSPLITVTSPYGSTNELELPATAWELHWSPDGSMLAVVCGPADGSGGTGWELVLVRP